MVQYQVTVTMSQATLAALSGSDAILYAFRVVQSDDGAARPLLWMQVRYSLSSYVTWQDGYQAYTSLSPVTPGQQVRVVFSASIGPGEVLRVEAGGSGTVTQDGSPGEIRIHNTTVTPWTCGISARDGAWAPFCAFPLHGGNLQAVTPLQKVLLMFASRDVSPGTVIGDFYASARVATAATLYTPGILINLSGEPQRQVAFDIDTGWSWGGYIWARTVPAGANLIPLLIESPKPAAETRETGSRLERPGESGGDTGAVGGERSLRGDK
jgi:hypothetical protein